MKPDVLSPVEQSRASSALAAAADGMSTPAVEEFVQRHGLRPHLDFALRTLGSVFDVPAPLRLSVARDPEFADEWLEVDLTSRGDPADVSAAFRRYTEAWLAAAPAHLRDRVRVIIGVE